MHREGCPHCGNLEIFQIYEDNLPRHIEDSIHYEMAIKCPGCGSYLEVVDRGDYYEVIEL